MSQPILPPHVLRPSALVDFDKCEYYYYLQWVVPWPRTDNHHTAFGTLFHDAVETYYRLLPRRGYDTAVHVATKRLLRKSHGYVGESPKDRYNLIRTFVYYTTHYQHEVGRVVAFGRRPILEYRFEFDTGIQSFTGENWCISMQIDRLMNTAGADDIHDIKTTKAVLDDRFFAGWSRSCQAYTYQLGANVLPNSSRWICIDGVQILANDSRFQKRPINISPAKLKHWTATTLAARLEQLNRCYQTNIWPQRFSSCEGRYGRCSHWDHCEQEPFIRQEEIDNVHAEANSRND